MRTLFGFFLTVMAFGLPVKAFAWGSIGHRTVAESSALLMNKSSASGWGPFLTRHRFELGIYSMYPDTVFRKIDGHSGKVETLTHFFDIDLALGIKPGEYAKMHASGEIEKRLTTLPREHGEAKKLFETLVGNAEKADSLGQSPWRVEQLMELIRNELKDVTRLEGGYQSGASAKGDARKAYLALFYLGVLSHYVSDAFVPHHSTADWNGYRTGQGGLHFYFETDCVDAHDPTLAEKVMKEAERGREGWLKHWKAVGKGSEARVAGLMYRVYLDSFQALQPLNVADRKNAIVKGSDPAKDEMAVRKPAQEGCRAMQKQVIERLAKGAVLTSYLWSLVLPEVAFSTERALQFNDFELSPEYIIPKYSKAP
jgi:hypothetical protein